MTAYRVNYNPITKIVNVESHATIPPVAVGGAFTDLGTFVHTPTDNSDGYDKNKVLYHFIQELLYKGGIQDMQSVIIFVDGVRSVDIGADAVIAVAGTHQITPVWTPTTAANKGITYTSSDPTKATVNASGLVTGVASGTTTITATTADRGFIDTKLITVS